MRKDLVRLWGEFNYALDHFFPKHFKYIFYITTILPYLTNSIARLSYSLFSIDLAYRIDLELLWLNAIWIFYLIGYKLIELVKNEWRNEN